MNNHRKSLNCIIGFTVLCGLPMLSSCEKSAPPAPDPKLAAHGSFEITAKLVEIPDGAIFQKDLYDYATILKYEVLQVHRGDLKPGTTIYIGHYNPWKARSDAADKRVKTIGGNLRHYRSGDIHRMALDFPIDDHYLGGIVDKYFGQHDTPAYWAVWTNAAP
jgi:hypothetical protein